MEKPGLSAPSRPETDAASLGLAVARNLARIYAEVLEEAPPDHLIHLLERWEGRAGAERVSRFDERHRQTTRARLLGAN